MTEAMAAKYGHQVHVKPAKLMPRDRQGRYTTRWAEELHSNSRAINWLCGAVVVEFAAIGCLALKIFGLAPY